MKSMEIAIIGTGRFGCFWGKELSKYFPIFAYDTKIERRSQVEQFARWCPLEECLKKEVVVLTIPIREMPSFLAQYGDRFLPGSLVMDCASVKMVVTQWFEQYLPEDVDYLPTHPLFGPDSAADGIEGHTLTIIPGRLSSERLQFFKNFFSNTLKLKLLTISPEEHDRLMAFNLSLMHHLGRALSELGIEQLPLQMASLKRALQISQVAMNDTRELFEDFYLFNPYADLVRGQFLEAFQAVGVEANQNLLEKAAPLSGEFIKVP